MLCVLCSLCAVHYVCNVLCTVHYVRNVLCVQCTVCAVQTVCCVCVVYSVCAVCCVYSVLCVQWALQCMLCMQCTLCAVHCVSCCCRLLSASTVHVSAIVWWDDTVLSFSNSSIEPRLLWERVEKLVPRPGSGSSSGSSNSGSQPGSHPGSQSGSGERFRVRCRLSLLYTFSRDSHGCSLLLEELHV